MQTTDARHLTWANFAATYLETGVPAICPVAGNPPVHLFVDASSARLGIRIPIGDEAGVSSSGLAEIEQRAVLFDGKTHLEVATSATALYREFYSFAQSFADKVQVDGVAPMTALQATLRSWRKLFTPLDLLSDDAQLGLIGELWFLLRLYEVHGRNAVLAWVGPLRESHDFRIGDCEFEVKSSTLDMHTHIINGLMQLVPSPGKRLSVISLEYGVSGPGQGGTLSDSIDGVRARLNGGDVLAVLEDRLGLTGFAETDRGRYDKRWLLRSAPRLVHVHEEFPRVTPDVLLGFGEDAQRILDVRYQLRLDGLGISDHEPDFEKNLRCNG